MTEGFIRVNPDEPENKDLDTVVLTNTDGREVHREAVFVASPTNFDAKQEVDEIPQAARVIHYDAAGNQFDPLTDAELRASSVDVGVTGFSGPAIDSFSRLRVSNPTTLFDSQSHYDDGTKDDWFHKVTGAASTAHTFDQACVTMSTTTGATDAVIRQSQRYIRYQPGKSQLIFITFDFKDIHAGATKRVGYFDGDNGIFLEFDGTTAYVVKRSKRTGSVVETKIASADWNLDPFDGTGPSGIIFDPTKSQIMVIDLQWLAVGRVRVGTDIGGNVHYVHEFTWANENSGVYMSTANLPVRYELIGNGVAASMDAICASVMSEGGFTADLGHEHVTPNSASKSCGTGADTPIISIRPKALFNTYTNRGAYVPTAISFYTTTNAVVLRTYHGGTLTSPTWVSSDAESGVEYDVTASAITGGHITTSEFGAAAGGGKSFQTANSFETLNRIFLNLDIDGNNVDGGNYTITGRGIGGTAVVYCNIHWTEIK